MVGCVVKSGVILDLGYGLPFREGRRDVWDLQVLPSPNPLSSGLLLPSEAGNVKCSGGNGELSFLLMISKHFKDEFAVSSSSTTNPQ